jgi:parallel beta-helix repeat protein
MCIKGSKALLAALCFSALWANAATLTVDCDAGNTIATALATVKPGDTVLVSGTCKEQVNILPEIVRITLDGQKKTTIQHPGGTQASPHALYNRGKEIIIKGFTVTGGLDGIHLSGPASAVIDGNVVVKNSGRGIHIDKGSIARILNTTVEQSGGIGVDVTGASYAYIGVFIPRVPALSPNTIRNNGGPGINIERTSGAWIVGNTISNNKESGIIVHRNAQADVVGNTINGNGGDGITVSYGSGVNFASEPRRDGPNQTTSGQNNSGVGIRCTIGGYVDGPAGSLTGAKGAKAIDSGCVDRVTK